MGAEGTNNYIFALLSFEGIDPYSQAGGLGVRVHNLGEALAQMGIETHIFFVGDPELPGEETLCDGRLILHRWCQWISRHHPNGAYDGEDGKVADYASSVPEYVADFLATKAQRDGKRLVVMAEEWQTADALMRLSDLLHWRGWRRDATLLWNANNTMSFHRINWGRLTYISHILAVSKFMKHVLWQYGVNSIVVPNGIPERLTLPLNEKRLAAIRSALGHFDADIKMFKIGRFDPAKRWMMAVEALAMLKARGRKAMLIVRGGIEPHGAEVLGRAASMGLAVRDLTVDQRRPTVDQAIEAIKNAPDADILNIRFFMPEEFVSLMYAAADCSLANSGFEPFGLVGLEVMASRGIAFTGATGEEYIEPFVNGVSVETDDPREIVAYMEYLSSNPDVALKLRQNAWETAKRFLWPNSISNLLRRIEFLSLP